MGANVGISACKVHDRSLECGRTERVSLTLSVLTATIWNAPFLDLRSGGKLKMVGKMENVHRQFVKKAVVI